MLNVVTSDNNIKAFPYIILFLHNIESTLLYGDTVSIQYEDYRMGPIHDLKASYQIGTQRCSGQFKIFQV